MPLAATHTENNTANTRVTKCKHIQHTKHKNTLFSQSSSC